MIYDSTEMTDIDEFEITATYGTAVFVVRKRIAISAGNDDGQSNKGGRVTEHGDGYTRHALAA
jgi:hypothetical protein